MTDNKPKFTPGPWYIKPRTVEQIKHQTYVSRTTVLNAPDGGYSPKHVIATVARGNGKEVENAALIAAAPEMYESEEENLGILLCIRKSLLEAFERIKSNDDVKKAIGILAPEMEEVTKTFSENMAFIEKRILEVDALLKKARGEAKA